MPGIYPALLAYSALHFGCLYVFGNWSLKKKGRLFLIKLSFMWLFGMFRALSRRHLNNLVIFPGNGNVNRVISFPDTEVNCSRSAVGKAPLPFPLPSFWNPAYKSLSSGLGWIRKEATPGEKAGGNSSEMRVTRRSVYEIIHFNAHQHC